MTQTHDITQHLTRIAGPLTEIFGDMERAEEQIEAACAAAPLWLRPLMFGSFLLMQPQMKMPAMLYEAHCRELLRRVDSGGDLDEPTVGEIGTAIYEMTLATPMRSVVAGLYMKIVQEAAPREFTRAGLDTAYFQFREEWPGQLEETRAEISRHIAKHLKPRTPPRPRSPGGQRRESLANDGILFPKEGDMHKLYTIGYSGLNPEDLKRWVEANDAIVVDTRMNAYSPRPQFAKAGLIKSLGNHYKHVQALGNVNYKNGGEIQIKNPAEGYRLVLEALSVAPVILLCGCKELELCHRKVISDTLESAIGSETIHLTPDDLIKTEPPLEIGGTDDSGDADIAMRATFEMQQADADLTQRGLFTSRDDRVVNPVKHQPKLF